MQKCLLYQNIITFCECVYELKNTCMKNFSSLLLCLMRNYQMLYFTSIFALKCLFNDLEYFLLIP